MSRPPRSEAPAGVYHITSRGIRAERTFRCAGDYVRFLGRFADVAGRHRLVCRAYCLMPNHFHLELDVPEGELSPAMHRLNSGYAHWFNRRYDVEGHLFQARFHSEYVDAEQHQLELSRYLPLNPVRAGLSAHPAEWPWSSYNATVGRVPAPPFLDVTPILEQFGGNVERARERFAIFVAEGAILGRNQRKYR